jgi:hypothetical protein
MCEGWAYDEVGRAEGVTAERIRQIVSEVLQKRKVDSGTEHARVQLARLERLMHFAGEAVARGELKQGRQEALSRELNLAARNLEVPVLAQAAVAARHVWNASSRRARSVRREVR